jgi:hypothetical protein
VGSRNRHRREQESVSPEQRHIRSVWPFVIGKACPVCGIRTQRVRTPLYFRIFRILLGTRVSTRFCAHCTWHGLGFH